MNRKSEYSFPILKMLMGENKKTDKNKRINLDSYGSTQYMATLPDTAWSPSMVKFECGEDYEKEMSKAI